MSELHPIFKKLNEGTVSQGADDRSALRFKKPEKIKRMVRSFAVTEAGKRKVESSKFTK